MDNGPSKFNNEKMKNIYLINYEQMLHLKMNHGNIFLKGLKK